MTGGTTHIPGSDIVFVLFVVLSVITQLKSSIPSFVVDEVLIHFEINFRQGSQLKVPNFFAWSMNE